MFQMAVEMYETKAWARAAKGAPFAPITIKRNLPGDDDVTFELKYCGICHTDVHIANNDMGEYYWPLFTSLSRGFA
jgi:uncharacterized zinc-type alcohol dehydrogenase-like protein